MQEAEEQDTCRICSAPAEPDQPLFHPCKCSGTIRYIHQDCLTTWLAHSKKKDCDVCKHPYSFNKVYAPDMPARLPPVLLLRHLAQQSLFALLFSIRAIVVGIVWLAVLPWVTVWTWRMYFSMGDSAAWWISDMPRPASSRGGGHKYYNLTAAVNGSSPTTSADMSVLARLASCPSWRTMSADIFAGQIIASLIVLTFVTVFLLREWISQNARPGVFDDEEVPALEDREVPQLQLAAAAPPAAPAQPQPQPHAQLEPPPVPRVNTPPPAPAPMVRANSDDRDDSMQRKKARVRGTRGESWGHGEGGDVDHGDDPFGPDRSTLPRRSRRRRHGKAPVRADTSDEDETWVRAAAPGHDDGVASVSGTSDEEGEDGMREYEFTFRADARRMSLTEPPVTPPTFRFGHVGMDRAVSEQAPDRRHIRDDVFASTSTSSSASVPFTFELSEASAEKEDASPIPSGQQAQVVGALRRPPLPATTLPPPDGGAHTPPLRTPSAALRSSAIQTPLASPGLATYRAPEELDAGPSRLPGYFDDDGEARTFTEEEHRRYFQEPVVVKDDAVEQPAVAVPPTTNAGLQLLDSDDDEEGEELDDDVIGGASDAELDEEDVDEEQEEEEEEEDRHRNIGAVNPEQAPADPAPADLVQAQDINDDLDGNVEDDMEGAMEAIGLRGPIHGVVQNAALMIFVLDTAIGLGVWLPFTIGKSTALLSLDPQRFLQILHLPIRAMRIITDPIVDSIMYLLVRVILPAWLRQLSRVLYFCLYSALFLTAKVIGQDAADKSFGRLTSVFSEQSLDRVVAWLASPTVTLSSETSDASSYGGLFSPDSWPVRMAEPYFALLGEQVRLGVERLSITWSRLAMGQGTSEKVFAILLGYVVVGILLSLYLNVLTVGNVKSAGKAVRSTVRQQLLVAKVATFIIIELVIFPLGCGLMLDACTIGLFPEASFQSRALFFLQAPVTAMFYHWVAGTMFMYQFAILLAACRGIMRPGAMWFIKDPQDQNFHPIRDILDRPTLTQLRKLFVSAIMYALVVECGVASVVALLLLWSKSILPFRWKNREPLSNVPIDLLFLHLVLPYTMHYFRPKRNFQKAALHVWKYLASRLRLTSYMFGDRRHAEEFTPKQWTWSLFIDSGVDVYDPENAFDGTFRRVPATDNLALPRDMRATAQVDKDGQPIDENARQIIAMQNAEAEKAKRDINDDYKMVYLPPHFRNRVLLFIFLLWVVGAVVAASLVALPIQFGRMFFKLFSPRDVHDGYSFIAGFYLLWACFLFGRAIDRMDRRRQRRGGDGPRARLPLYVAKHGFLWLVKISYLVLFLGFFIPALISLVVEFYIVLPIRLTWNPAMSPRIRIVDMWALGLLYGKIALRSHRLPPNQVTRGLTKIANNGWTNPDPVSATKEIIVPMVAGLLGMIVLPAAILRAGQYFFPILAVDNKFLFKHIYPGMFAITGFSRSVAVLFDILSVWAQSIRDKEFLVEMRLRNHEPEPEKVNESSGNSAEEVVVDK